MISSAIGTVKCYITIRSSSIIRIYRDCLSGTIIRNHTKSAVLSFIINECFCGQFLARAVVVSQD